MKILINVFLLIFLIACSKQSGISSNVEIETHKHEKKIESYYTCAMHPQIHEEKPGKCPICHMNLTKVVVDEVDSSELSSKQIIAKDNLWVCKNFPDVTSLKEDICPIDGTPMVKKKPQSAIGDVIGRVKLRKAQLSHFRPDIFEVTKMKMSKNIRLLGSVLQSEESESRIPARVSGRVEKVYVKSTGSHIKKGSPVVDIYSPKLISAGEEYLIARSSYQKSKSSDFKEMVEQSRERLKLFGIKNFQFESWYKKKNVPRSITIYSPVSGVVQKKNAIVGKYFKEGQNFFELSDLSSVWVEMDIYEQDSALVSLGQQVKLEFVALPGIFINGEIDFVGPILDPKSRTLKVRTTILNSSGKLKPGMVAEATLSLNLEGQPLVIPRSALIDSGKRKVVWIKKSDKLFQAKVVHIGYESEGYVEVKHGLHEGEEVVIEGNFLLDAQAQLFGGYEDTKNGTSSAGSGHNH